MSLIDKNKFSAPDAKDIAKSVADSSGIANKVNQKINDLTAPVSDAVNKAKVTYAKAEQEIDSVKNTFSETQNKVNQIGQKYSDIADNELFKSHDNFTITPPEVLEKQMKDAASKFFASYGGDIESQFKNSHIVYSTVQIGGQDVLKDSHFTLEIHQKMAEHDEFEISCYAEAFGDKNAYPMTNSRNLLGNKVTIQFKQYGQTAYIFTGIITEITNKKIDGHNKLFIKGQAPTILLENGLGSRSFEQKTLKDIIGETTSEYPTDLISLDLRPHMEDELQYTVQYRESDWDFIKRLALRYGEWFYYNGQQIVFGGSGGKTEELLEEQDIYNYELKMKLVPQKFTYVSYDAKRAKNHTVDSESIPITHRLVNPFQQHAIKASEEIYSKVPLSLYNQSLLEKGEPELRKAVERQKLSRQNVFFLEAKTNNPNLRLGDIVKMQAWMPGHDVFKTGAVPLESYKIIEISHYQDLTEGYYNILTGIPMDNQVPAYMDEDAIPLCEEQSAIVKDNNDPEGMSRIRVQFPWQIPFNGMTPWIRSITPYAGKGKGMHVVPEIDEEVIISFENGNAEKPVSLGAMFNGNGKSGHGGNGNYTKSIQTPSGSGIEFNDKHGHSLIKDAVGDIMKLDGAGTSSIYANSTGVFTVGKSGESKINMTSSGDITIDGTNSLKITIGASIIEISKDGTIKINGKIITIESTESFKVKSVTSQIIGTATTEVGGGVKTKITGMVVSVLGSIMNEIKAALIKINS